MISTAQEPVYFLLVDDLQENLIALEALLRRDGLVMLKARSGQEALEHLLKHEVALALVDVQMPSMDGFELAELMRGAERTRRVPIIFLTAGSANLQRRFRGYEAGAVDFLHKPIESDILRSKADVFFEMYRQRQEVARQRDELKAAAAENVRLLEQSQRTAEALKEAGIRKDEFLAMLAHELRNPLAPIRNAVEILRLGGMSEAAVTKARAIIDRQVSHMTRLVEDLLDVARIGRGKIELRMELCDIGAIVRQTAEDYRPTLAAVGVELWVNVPEYPLMLYGDAVRLAQIVGNLLHNAGKFTPRGGRVEVQVSSDAAGDAAVIAVRDTGTGMEADVLARVFDPFSQADQNLDRSQGGLGLGLALVHGLVEQHDGKVKAESPGSGQGSTLTIRLPLSRARLRAARKSSEAAVLEGPRQLKVLVVEDNRDAAESLQLLLTLLGHEVELAYDGQSGLDTFRKFQPDVLVSDLGLPGELDGYAVARAVRADPEFAKAHLIALSGYGQDEDRRRAKEAGFDEHLVKPVDPTVLEEALATVSRNMNAH